MQNILVNREEAKFEVECRCLLEMKKDKVYNITATIFTETSNVGFAECSFPADRGLMAAVSTYVAATLFALENFHTFYVKAKTKDEISCTSKLQKWNQPRKRHLDLQPSNDICFKV